MSKIFLAAPFKACVDPLSGDLVEPLKRRLLSLTQFFEEMGFFVFNAHKREGWGREMMTPEVCTRTDFEQIGESEWLVAIPGSPASPGTHIEIGWASAMGKRIVLLLEKGGEYAFLVRGLHTVADVTYVHFDGDDDCLAQLSRIFAPCSV